MYKVVSLLVSVLGSILAAAIFKRVWKLVAGEDEAPQATDADRGWPEILIAAGLHGALFAVIRAGLDRAAASGTHKLTGTWPGDEGPKEARKQETEAR